MTRESLSAIVAAISSKLELLADKGVRMIDPRQVYVAPEVDVSRIAAGVTLYPGVRIEGGKTYIGAGSVLGTQGPVVVRDCVLGRKVELASGYFEESVLRDYAVAGPQAQFRAGTLLEEYASVAHCVGLKQTLLLPYATLGSLINFCDCLLAGGTSRQDHSEVGSGFIHFNFTPWGERGDKATASLFGDVVRGVFCDQPRVFLGGLSGAVGPRNVGFGAVAAAGQVLRRDIAASTMSYETLSGFRRDFSTTDLDAIEPRATANIAYIAQVIALRRWYQEVRAVWSANASDETSAQLDSAGASLLELVLDQRHQQLARFLRERDPKWAPGQLQLPVAPSCPVSAQGGASFLDWVKSLAGQQRLALEQWLSDACEADRAALRQYYS